MSKSGPASARVRDATTADMPAVTGIYGHHVRYGLATFEEVAPDPAEMTRRRESYLSQGMPYLVAESVDGQKEILGYAYCGPYRPRPAYRFTVEDSIYVHPERTGRGVGRLLLAELIGRAEALGYRQMMAVIGDSGNLGSIKLHEALGFRNVGQMKSVGFKLGRWVDVVLLQRALGAGDGSLPAPSFKASLSEL